MSGGVGPTCNDISLPREDEAAYKQQDDPKASSKPTTITTKTGSSFLSFRQLNALAVIIVFSASGMVSPQDFAFVIFSLLYLLFLSQFAFPSLHPTKEPHVFNPQNKVLRFYVTVGAIIGLFLPIGYIVEGIVEGDKEGIKAAAPHVFLLASQIFMEGVAFSDQFSTPTRVFVPVFYNSRRIFSIVDWLRTEVNKVEAEHGGSSRRVFLGRALAFVNMVFWCFNLFGFLLPVYLPKAFKTYYSGTAYYKLKK